MGHWHFVFECAGLSHLFWIFLYKSNTAASLYIQEDYCSFNSDHTSKIFNKREREKEERERFALAEEHLAIIYGHFFAKICSHGWKQTFWIQRRRRKLYRRNRSSPGNLILLQIWKSIAQKGEKNSVILWFMFVCFSLRYYV